MKIAIRPFQLNLGKSKLPIVVESYRELTTKPVIDFLEAAVDAAMLVTRMTLLGKSGNSIIIHVMTQVLRSYLLSINPDDGENQRTDLDFVGRAQFWLFLDDNAIGGSTQMTLADWLTFDSQQPDSDQV